jgi:type II pantothenate kinase
MDSLVNGKRQKQQQGSVSKEDGLYIMATGGGAYKYYDKIKEALGVEIYREDEMECLIVGMLILIAISWTILNRKRTRLFYY